LCVLHLLHGSNILFEHLSVVYQIVMNQGVVPDLFCLGVIVPILKKGKPLDDHPLIDQSRFHPYSVSCLNF